MALYELTNAAEADIHAIARYTISTWGLAQARRYEVILESHLQAIDARKPGHGWFSSTARNCSCRGFSITMFFLFSAKNNVPSSWRCSMKTWI